jgi:iron complex transport system substrate-binding protein
LLAAGVVTAGCGSGGSVGPASAANRQVVDATGAAVSVPANPLRVAALGEQTLDDVLALGVEPVVIAAARGEQGAARYLGTRGAGLPVGGTAAELKIEKIAAQKPDLILVDGGIKFQPVLPALKKLAPVFVTAKTNDQAKDPWRPVLARIGDVLNRKTAASTAVSDYQRAVLAAKAKLGPNSAKTVSIVRWQAKGPGYLRGNATAVAVLADIGLRHPQQQNQPGATLSDPVSLENLSQLDADWIFVGSLNSDGAKGLAQARQNALFRQLKAVQANRTVAIDATYWAAPIGVQGATLIVADVQRNLAAT